MNTGLLRMIRFGARGEDVRQVQDILNQVFSVQPLLVTDGIFGNKSATRSREFQSKNNLLPDGIIGARTWAKLMELLGKIPATKPVDARTGMRRLVLTIASGLVGKVNFGTRDVDGRPTGIDLVKLFFHETTRRSLTDSNFFYPGTNNWVIDSKPFVDGNQKSWCGIFCIYCYRMAGFTNIGWDLGRGKPTGPIALRKFKNQTQFVEEIQVADIGTVAFRQHHFLIESVYPNDGAYPRLHTIDGNWNGGKIEKQHGYWRADTRGAAGNKAFNCYTLL